jgi:hypothetical protein
VQRQRQANGKTYREKSSTATPGTITNYKEHSSSWDASSSSASREIPRNLLNPNLHLVFSNSCHSSLSWARSIQFTSYHSIPILTLALASHCSISVRFPHKIVCECCMLSDVGLCDGPITRPEESYRVSCILVWSRNLNNEKAYAHEGCPAIIKTLHHLSSVPTTQNSLHRLWQQITLHFFYMIRWWVCCDYRVTKITCISLNSINQHIFLMEVNVFLVR